MVVEKIPGETSPHAGGKVVLLFCLPEFAQLSKFVGSTRDTDSQEQRALGQFLNFSNSPILMYCRKKREMVQIEKTKYSYNIVQAEICCGFPSWI